MAREKIKYWNSIVARFGLFITLIIISSVLSLGYLVFKKSAETIKTKSQQEITHTVKMAARSFNALRNEVANDIAFLSQNPLLEQYTNYPTKNNKEQLQRMFGDFLRRKSHYFQIRLIGNDSLGTEIIRLDKLNDSVKFVPENELQAKGDRGYFKKSIGLSHGQFYFSPINLNEEYGRVSQPLIPTFRAAGTVRKENSETKGIVVINVDLNALYSELIRMQPRGMELYIVDEDDQFLFASNVEICFSEQLEHNVRFDSLFKANYQSIASNPEITLPLSAKDGTKLLSYCKPLGLNGARSEILLIGMLEEKVMLLDVLKLREQSMKITLIIACISIFIIILFTSWFFNRLNKVTSIISAYEKDDALVIPSKILNQRNEIGLLMRVVRNMKLRIDSQFAILQDALEKKKEAIKSKDEFLQNVSHELRTPLNTILGLTQILKKDHLTAKNESLIHSLYRSAHTLSSLMLDILDHKKLQTGTMRIEIKDVNLHQFLTNLHSTYQYDAKEKGLEFRLNLQALSKDKVHLVDPVRLEQIISNLVVNAIKYTSDGYVELRASTNNGQIKIEISDSGRGLSKEQINFLTGVDGRLETSHQLGTDSYGLGLMVVKQLVILLKGSVEINQSENFGSKITILIPWIKQREDELDLFNKVIPFPTFSGRYVIYHLEDDALTRHLILHSLGEFTFQIVQKSNFEEFEKLMIESGLPDLIISDLMINSKHIGEEVIALKKGGNPPVIFTSGLEIEQMRLLNQCVVQKPFDIILLQNLIFAIIGKNEFEQLQMDKMYTLYDHNVEKIQNYLQLLLNEFETYIDRITMTLQNGNQNEWEAICHKIIASLKSLSLYETKDLFTDQINELSEADQDKIIQQLRYCLCYIKKEIYLNSIK